MGLCGETKKKKSGKTIIIPKGVVNPNDQTVIEIPIHLDTISSLIVKAPTDPSSCLTVEPFQRGLDYTQQPYRTSSLPNPPPNQSVALVPATTNPPTASARTNPPNNTTETASNTESPSKPRQRKVNTFGTQTFQQESSSSGKSTSTCPLERVVSGQSSHSPLCPICTQIPTYTCPHLSPLKCFPNQNLLSSGRMDRSLTLDSALLSPSLPRYGQCRDLCPNFTDSLRSYRLPDFYSSYPMRICRSEKTFKEPSKNQSESDLLDRLLDEKINKILKPVLLSLVKSYADEEEREISSKSSYGSFDRPRRRWTSPDTDSSSFDTNRRCWWSDSYEKYDRYSRRNRTKDTDDDEGLNKRRSNVCTPTSGCPYKKQSVNFDKRTDSPTSTRLNDAFSEKSIELLPRRETSSTDLFRRRTR